MDLKEKLKKELLLRKLNRLAIPQLNPQTIATISTVDRKKRLVLSFAQQRLWFLSQMDGASEAYHIAGGVRLTGKLNHKALRQALNRIIMRHEALRTTFIQIDGTPEQHIGPIEESHFHLLEHDLSTESNAEHALQRLAEQEALAPFDLTHLPLIRGRLIKMSVSQHVLLVTMHHIVSDGWSMGVLVNELSILYGSYSREEPDPLPQLSIQYPDYAAWQRSWVEGERLQKQANYWKIALTGAPALLELPTDYPRPTEQNFVGDTIDVLLDAELTTKLKHLSHKYGTTLFMTMLASWTLLLSRLSGQDQVVVGTPSANRARHEIENLIGLFVNTLAIRIDFSGNPTVEQLLTRVKEQSLEAQAHQDIPFEQIVEIIKPPRSMSHSPLFQVMFTWQNAPEGILDLPGLELAPISSPRTSAKFDLSLFLQEKEGLIVGQIEYATALFEQSTVERYLGYWQTLLQDMLVEDSQNVDQLSLLSPTERRTVLYDWNATKTDYSNDKCIHELFEAQVAKTPNAVAVVYEEQQLTYAELNTQSNQLAHYLRTLGVGPDRLVGICVERGLNMMTGLLGILKAGGAYVPLDPAYPEERLSYMLKDSAPTVILVDAVGRQALIHSNSTFPVLDLDRDAMLWADTPNTNIAIDTLKLTPQHLAYVIYTSGSTGQPKGVALMHSNAVNFISWAKSAFVYEAMERTLFSTSLNFDLSIFECFVPITIGATINLVKNALDLLHNFVDVTLLNTVPSAMHVLIDERSIPTNVRNINLAGEPLKQQLVEQIFRDGLLVESVCNLYGPTETTTYSTWVQMKRGMKFMSHIGRPIANTRIYLLDPYGAPVPIGVAGELYIGGAGVARGYLNQPTLTAERFLPDPFAIETGELNARMYKTGDLARWLPDGNIEFLGRNDFQVKIRGFRIELGEIEARLAMHPLVKEVTVIAREDTPGDKRLTAYYTCTEDITVEDLRTHLTATLPDYMVPAAYVRLETFPLTPNGKLDRKALPAPEGDAYATRTYVAPQGEIEQTIAQIWAELLKVEQVGRHDNFFELGGHSLLAVTLIERMRRVDLHTDVRTLFTALTLADLTAALNHGTDEIKVPPNQISASCKAITPDMLPLITLNQTDIGHIVTTVPNGVANIQDIYALGPLQEGILFHHLLAEQGDAYLLSALMAFDTRERLDGFLAAMQVVIARHDILRTAVVWAGLSEPAQVVWRKAILPVETIEFDVSEGDIATKLVKRFDPRHYRIDLNIAPLMRAFIAYDPEEERWLLLFLIHHLTTDHTTLEILTEEVLAYQQGRANQLPAPQPFRNFIAQVRLGVSPTEHETFFHNMLGDVDETTAPFGLINVQGDGSDIAEARLRLDDSLAQRIRECAKVVGVSAASLIHLAWAQVLAHTSGRGDVVFGTVLFGRMQGGTGADRVLGMFINTLPICIHIDSESALSSLHRVHRTLVELLYHEHASLTLAQRCSAVPAGIPLFTALLNYRHSAENAGVGTGVAWEGIDLLNGEERTNYPIVLSVDDMGKGFLLSAQTAPSVAPERVCDFMKTALEQLVIALETTPNKAIHNITVLPDAERRTVLYDWNATKTDYSNDKCIHELFEAQVAKTPNAVAVVYEEQQLTYAELNTQSNQLAHYLRTLGVGPDRLVGICVERGLNMMTGLLGILKAGGAYVPLDPAYPEERLSYMLKDSAPTVILVDAAGRQALIHSNSTFPVLDLDRDAMLWADTPNTNIAIDTLKLTPQHLAYVIYTSGSTGQPKGVMNEHIGIANRLSWMQSKYELKQGDRVLQKTPFSFDVSVWEFFWPLITGARLVMARPGGHKDPNYLNEIILRENITTLHFVPPMLQVFLEFKKATSYTSLIRVICSGEALPSNLVNQFHQQLPKIELHNLYGPTEAAVDVTAWHCIEDFPMNNTPIGRPIANTRIYLLDPYGAPVPIGVAGELYIGGVQVARGYLNQPTLTAERFLPDPFAIETGELNARMYKTGDLARWLPDGNIEFLGRNDFQVKIRGFRIELGEIEARLAMHPLVKEVTVIAREDTPGDKRLTAYYTCTEDITVEDLRTHLTATLPDYMVPAAYVRLETFPLTPNGKLDRKALPAPEGDAYAIRTYVAPQGEIEQTIAQIWAELLKVEQVGRHDNFFELGGHSLQILQVLSLLKQKRIEITVAALFKTPTIASLSLWLDNKKASALEPHTIPLRIHGKERPLFLIHDGSGEVLYGHNLTQNINAEIPIYGLEGQPLGERFYQTMQAMAKHQIRKIRSIQPQGPYRLAGWSFGGTLAYEIASQLIGEDETVDFLGLLDTTYFHGVTRENKLVIDNGDEEEIAIAVLLEIFGRNADFSERYTEIKLDSASISFAQLVRICQDLSLLPDHLSGEEIKSAWSRMRKYFIADSRYYAEKLPIQVSLFATQEATKKYPFNGWDSVLPANHIRLISVPGSHGSMVTQPFVQALGEAMSTAMVASPDIQIKEDEHLYSTLVTIQSGHTEVVPLFCVPGAGSSVASFTELAVTFGDSRHIYGLQPRGLYGEAIPHSTVSAAANAYILAIQNSYPDGPLHLLGHSFGGWVVFEMAQRLKRAGRTILSVTLVDTEVPDEMGCAIRDYSRVDVLMELVKIYQQSTKLTLGINYQDFDGLEHAAQLELLHKTLVRVELMPKQSRPEVLKGTLSTFDAAMRTHYYPEVYSDAVYLILATDDCLNAQATQQSHEKIIDKWRRWAPKLVHLQTQGNHITALKSPHVSEITSWLQLD